MEKLAPPEKLLIASTIVGKRSPKNDSVYESVQNLASWRNAFAHGHCVDRPTKSLRHNHLKHPEEFSGLPSDLTTAKNLVGGYLRLSDHLREISINSYTSGKSAEAEDIRAMLKDISKFRLQGNNWVYDIILDQKTQGQIARIISNVVEGTNVAHKALLEDMFARLSPFGEMIFRMEFGIDNGERLSREKIMEQLGLSSAELAKERGIALTQMIDLDKLIQENSQ